MLQSKVNDDISLNLQNHITFQRKLLICSYESNSYTTHLRATRIIIKQKNIFVYFILHDHISIYCIVDSQYDCMHCFHVYSVSRAEISLFLLSCMYTVRQSPYKFGPYSTRKIFEHQIMFLNNSVRLRTLLCVALFSLAKG